MSAPITPAKLRQFAEALRHIDPLSALLNQLALPDSAHNAFQSAADRIEELERNADRLAYPEGLIAGIRSWAEAMLAPNEPPIGFDNGMALVLTTLLERLPPAPKEAETR